MRKSKKDSRGGFRPGAGAPPKGERAKVTRSIYVDPLDWERWKKQAKAAGFSGVSEWLSELAANSRG